MLFLNGAIKTAVTLHLGPTIQTKMSLATASIYCMINPAPSGAMEDDSVVLEHV